MSTTTKTTEAARLCGELVTLLTCARDYAKNPNDFSLFHIENLVNSAADLTDDLYDILLKAAAPEIRARQLRSEGVTTEAPAMSSAEVPAMSSTEVPAGEKSGLAFWLLNDIFDRPIFGGQNSDLIDWAEDVACGSLGAAMLACESSDLLKAVVELDVSIELAEKPIQPPGKGVKKKNDFMAATYERERLLHLAQIARVLVLDEIRSKGGAA